MLAHALGQAHPLTPRAMLKPPPDILVVRHQFLGIGAMIRHEFTVCYRYASVNGYQWMIVYDIP